MSKLPVLATVTLAAITAAAWRTPRIDFAAAETARIRVHLDSVERELRAKDVSALTPAQRAARLHNLDVLHAYWVRGVFPRNTDFPGVRVPYFIDRFGTRCAMAYLIEQSGDVDFVARVAAAHNNARIRELRDDPELVSWLWRNGVTWQEAARIQPAYGCCPPGAFCVDASQAPCPSTTSTSASAGYKTTTGVAIVSDVVTVALGTPHRLSGRAAGTLGLLTGALGVAIGAPNFDDAGSRRTVGFVNAGAGLASMALGMFRIARADARAGKFVSRLSVGPLLTARREGGISAQLTF